MGLPPGSLLPVPLLGKGRTPSERLFPGRGSRAASLLGRRRPHSERSRKACTCLALGHAGCHALQEPREAEDGKGSEVPPLPVRADEGNKALIVLFFTFPASLQYICVYLKFLFGRSLRICRVGRVAGRAILTALRMADSTPAGMPPSRVAADAACG